MAEKVCLIDGSGYIFRAFYGLPPLTAPDGTPVKAVYGFTNMFFKLTTKIGCAYCLVLFDAKRQNFRNSIFPDYKGTRKETPEELIPQFPIIREAVDALNINFLEMEGYEADDLIATYAEKALAEGKEVVVVSGDKDLMQLIRPGVEFYDPMKDKFFTPEDVKEKFGVYPEKVVQVQALSGDSIDNVPGVAGIGPKTAAQLINEYGDVENLLAHAHEIKQEKRRQTLLDNAENARISLQLVTLKKDVPVEVPLQDFHCHCPQAEVVHAFIEKYGFNSLKARVDKWLTERCSQVDATMPCRIEKKYSVINTEAEIKALADKIKEQGAFSFAVVASGANPTFDALQGLAVATKAGEAYYLPYREEATAKTM
ncbi:MAG: DNA polymerase I, partial [Alphaproteobacteria bacterium]|nr:DNA polymerase I [Alphaproteobacteria bacterium]